MALPNAPLPLFQQALNTGNVVITVPLQGLTSGAQGFIPGSTFNSGNPTATFTLPIGVVNAALGPNGQGQGQAADANSNATDLLNLIDRLWREGSFSSIT